MGGKTSTTTQGVSIPKEVMDRYNAINARAENVAGTPFQTYSTNPADFVAQINEQQQQGINNVNSAAGAYKPYFDQAALTFSQGMKSAQPGALNLEQFYNPFQQQVIDATTRQMAQANEQAQSGALGTAVSSGAFGGDRAGIAAANLANQQGLAMGSTLAGLNAQNYNQALAAAQQQQGVYLGATQADLARLTQGGQFYAGLGQAAQQAGLQGAEAQINAGTLGQQTEQAGKTALYNQFQQKNAYPFQVAQFLANIGMGTGALSGSTTTTTQPSSFFSDRRLKEDVQRIGEGDNGLPIYKYRYKGEPETHIGFMADEVEKVRPEAVGLHPTGYKTVDYDRATKAEGGVAGPYGSTAGSQPGVAGYVPEAYLPVGQLMVADSAALGNAEQGLAEQLDAAARFGSNLAGLKQTFGKDGDFWLSNEQRRALEAAGQKTEPASRAWRGGVAGGYADGGAAYLNTGLREQNPVDKRTYLSDIVSAQEDAKRRDSLQSPGSVPQARTTGQDVADLAKVALAFMGMNRGGRTGYATRGGVSEEDMRRLSEMRPGDPTDILPSGVVPQPSRITKPVTYEPQAPNWQEVTTNSNVEPRTYQYDTNYGMVRDAGTGQLISNERSISRNETSGIDKYTDTARDDAIREIDRQIGLNRVAAQNEADRALERISEASGTNTGSYAASGQDPRQQFPELYNAYQEAQRRLNSANAVVMPSSITNRFGDQAKYMIAEAYRPSVGMVTGVMPRNMGDEAPAIIPGSEAAPVRAGLSALPMTTDAMTPPGAQVQPSSLGFSGLRPANIEDAGISTGSIRPRARPANLDTMATVITPTGLRPQRRPTGLVLGPGMDDLAAAGIGGLRTVPVADTTKKGVALAAISQKGPQVDTGRVASGSYAPIVTVQDQLNFVTHELQKPEYDDYIKTRWSSPEDAAVGFDTIYERSGGSGNDVAAKNARDIYEAAQAGDMSGFAPNVQTAYNHFISTGMDPVQAAGATGRLMVESYAHLDPNARLIDGSGNGTYGIAQWRGDRLEELSRFTGVPLKDIIGAPSSTPEGRYYSANGVAGSGAAAREPSGLAAGVNAPMGGDKAWKDRTTLGKMFYNPDGRVNKDALLSILGGIGAMASSPSRYLGAAILQGVGGAANTYAALEKQRADVTQQNLQNAADFQKSYMRAVEGFGYKGSAEDYARQIGYTGPISLTGGINGVSGVNNGTPSYRGAPLDAYGRGMTQVINIPDVGNVQAGQTYGYLKNLETELQRQVALGVVDQSVLDTVRQKLAAHTGQLQTADGRVVADPTYNETLFGAAGVQSDVGMSTKLLEGLPEATKLGNDILFRNEELAKALKEMNGKTGILAQPLATLGNIANQLGLIEGGTYPEAYEKAIKSVEDGIRAQMEALAGTVDTSVLASAIRSSTANPSLTGGAAEEMLAVQAGTADFILARSQALNEAFLTNPNVNLAALAREWAAENPISKFVDARRPEFKGMLTISPAPKDVPQAVWDAMTPEERKLWTEQGESNG